MGSSVPADVFIGKMSNLHYSLSGHLAQAADPLRQVRPAQLQLHHVLSVLPGCWESRTAGGNRVAGAATATKLVMLVTWAGLVKS
jgi:hypothetical protein